MAAKNNNSEADIDITVFEWSKVCAFCHPGGGPMEYDRDGLRYDERAVNGPAPLPFDGDYYGSDWANSGVLEADCLLCHLESYRTSLRNTYVALGHHRVAPSAGAQMGTPRDNTIVEYDPTFKLNIQKRPADRNCSQCHAGVPGELFNAAGALKADIAKRGRSWDDPNNPDVHDINLGCVSCHHAGTSAGRPQEDHQIEKGHIKVGSAIRDDLDNTLPDCADCHSAGSGFTPTPPVPTHTTFGGLADLHLSKIHCSTCHIPGKKLFAVNTLDFLEGAKVPFFIGGNPMNPYGGGFQPAYLWWHRETEPPYTWKIYPFNYMTAVFWNRGNTELDAFFSKQIKPIFDTLVSDGKLTNDIPDPMGMPEPNTTQEIQDFVNALTDAGLENPTVWVSPEPFQLSHNVAPADEALGSGGCTDCHTQNSQFFSREITLLPWDFEDLSHVKMELHVDKSDGTSETLEDVNRSLPMWKLLGYTEARKDSLEVER